MARTPSCSVNVHPYHLPTRIANAARFLLAPLGDSAAEDNWDPAGCTLWAALANCWHDCSPLRMVWGTVRSKRDGEKAAAAGAGADVVWFSHCDDEIFFNADLLRIFLWPNDMPMISNTTLCML